MKNFLADGLHSAARFFILYFSFLINIIDSFFIHSAQLIQLLYRTVLYKCVGYADALYVRGVVVVRHKLQNGTSHAAFSCTVFYGNDAFEVVSRFM